MSQANPFFITAVKDSPKDQELHANELAVLRQKLRAFTEALRRCFKKDPENVQSWNQTLLSRLHEYDVNLNNTNKLEKCMAIVGFVYDYEFDVEDKYDKEVAQNDVELLRYCENHPLPDPLPGAQV